ncbi:MAG: hypothetical protein ACJAZO_003740 [Myxococcota bacterium]|jgi:hypothetical protein
MTIEELFPGKMGRVELTRVAISLRLPDLMRAKPSDPVSPELLTHLQDALKQVRKE